MYTWSYEREWCTNQIKTNTLNLHEFETEYDDAHHGATFNVFLQNKNFFLQMNCTESEKKN